MGVIQKEKIEDCNHSKKDSSAIVKYLFVVPKGPPRRVYQI